MQLKGLISLIKSVVLSSILFFSLNIEAQESKPLDSLKNLAKIETNNIKKILLWEQISLKYNRNNVDSILHYAKKIEKLSKKENFEKGKNIAYYHIGMYYFNTSDYNLAISYFSKQIEGCLTLGDKKEATNGYNNLAGCYYKTSKFYKAIENLKMSLEIAEKIGYDKQICRGLSNMANIYSKIGNYEKSIEYIKQYDATSNCTNTYHVYDILQTNYKKMKAYNEALFYAKKLDSLININANDYEEIGYMSLNYGEIYKGLDSIDVALKYFNQGIDIYKKNLSINKEVEIALLKNAATIQFKKNDIDSAILKAEKSYVLAKETNINDHIYKTAKLLFDIYKSENKEKEALKYLNISIQYGDSITSINNQDKRNQKLILKKQYLIQEEKDNDIQLAKFNNKIWVFSSIIIIILILISIFYYSNRKLTRAKNKVEITLQERLELESKMREIERANASGLEETFSDKISYIEKSYDVLSDMLDNHTKEEDVILAKHSLNLKNNINLLINDTKDLFWVSNGENDRFTTLIEKVKQVVENFNKKTEKQIDLITNQDKEYRVHTLKIKQILYTIKEIINNFEKHANVNKLVISITIKDNLLKINLKDLGKGFDIRKINHKNGLINIKNRVETLGFNIDFLSEIDKGTSISIYGSLLALNIDKKSQN